MPHQPPRTAILRSSYDAMQFDCPLGHGKKGETCKTVHSSDGELVTHAAVVCPERRALVNIYAPGQYVTWDGRPVK